MRGLFLTACLAICIPASLHAQTLLRTVEGASSYHEQGWSLASTGDLDNDGLGDLVVGCPGASGGFGAARIVSGIDGDVIRTHLGEGSGHRFGEAVASGRDVNGDGVDDVIIGAAGWDLTHAFDNRGKIYVFSGATGGLIHSVTGSATLERLGTSVAMLSDLNGDGRAEFAAGAPGAAGNTGSVEVFSGLTGLPLMSIPGTGLGGQFGTSLAITEDMNGDGEVDLIIGAPTHPQSATAGQVTIIEGGTWGLIRDLQGLQSGESFGWTVAATGDLDGDLIPDLAVGAPDYDAGGTADAGRARAYSGANGAFLWEITGPHIFMKAGMGLDGVGDLDGDGGRDVIVGMPYIPP